MPEEERGRRIAAVLNVYNDSELLEGMYRSIEDKIDYFVAADGRYKDFPGDTAMSNDGTQGILDRIADEVITRDCAWSGEAEKRNALLDAVPDDHWVLRIDADERLVNWDASVFDDLRCEDALFVNARIKHWERDTDEYPKTIHEPVLLSPEGDWAYQTRDSLTESGRQLVNVPKVTTDKVLIHNQPYERPSRRSAKRRYYRNNHR